MTNRRREAFHVWAGDKEGYTYVATVNQESVEDILRPLAERRVAVVRPDLEAEPRPRDGGGLLGALEAGPATEERLDPRFDALRCSHKRTIAHDMTRYEVCRRCGTSFRGDHEPDGIDATLGAIVRAAASCGLRVEFISWSDGRMHVVIGEFTNPCNKDNLEEAAARALVAAERQRQPRG